MADAPRELTAQELFDCLYAPFASSDISWRVGAMTKDKKKGMALAYIDARVVMERLDAVCGPAGWQCRYPHANGKTVCEVGIKIDGEWLWKADGAGDSDVEAEKGALSDAFKRAAVRWGVGRYLYNLDSPWVPCNEWKQIEAAELSKLEKLHEDAAAKIGWGPRAGVICYRMLLMMVKNSITQPSQIPPFLAKYSSMIAQFPVAMRKHLQTELDRIGGVRGEQEAA